MAGETTLTYNGVSLSYIETASVHSEAVKDPSGMDHMYNRHTIEVTAVLAFSRTSVVPPAMPGETPAQTMARVGHMLAVPRRPFVYAVDGMVLFKSDGLDQAGGPFPVGQPSITQITPQSFEIKYTIEFCENDCPENARTQTLGGIKGLPAAAVQLSNPLWLSIRWTQEQDIDEFNYSTIITTGRAIFGADVLRKLGGADQLRGLVVPPVPNNFIRKSKYTIQENGLQLDFVHVDQEQYIMPPDQTGKISGSFTHRFIKGGGKWFANVILKLEGRKNTPKARLMATAVSIAYSRLKAADIQDDGKKPFVMDGKFTEQFEKNSVEVELAAITSAPHATTGTMTNATSQDQSAGKSAGILIGLIPGSGLAGGVLGTAGSLIGEAITDSIRKQRADAQARAAQNQAGNPGILPLNLQQWGTPLLGCPNPDDAAAGISPDLYGNFPALRLMAAAFRDPCLTSTLSLAQQSNTYPPIPSPPGYPTTPTGDRPSLTNRPPYPASSQVSTLSSLPPIRYQVLRTIRDPYQGVYDTYEIECLYSRKENCDVLASTTTAQPGIAAAGKKVQWANPELSLLCRWTATKIGVPPTVPDPTSKDTNTVLIDSALTLSDVKLTGDGAHLSYTIGGEYFYKFLDITKANVSIPVAPFMGYTSAMIVAPPIGDAGIFRNPATSSSSLVSR